MTVIQFPSPEADHPLAVGLPNPERLDLELSGAFRPGSHSITIWPTLWDDTRRCIALMYDGLNDHRTPALTPADARRLAGALVLAADALEEQ